MSDRFDLIVRKSDDVGILETEGYLNNLGAEMVSDACADLIDGGIQNIVVNLKKSRIVTSIGISILIEVLLRIQELNGVAAFCSVTPTVAKTFQIMGLLNASKIFDSETEAIEALAAIT
jgi:anti-anti-sigma factor